MWRETKQVKLIIFVLRFIGMMLDHVESIRPAKQLARAKSSEICRLLQRMTAPNCMHLPTDLAYI
jgi:hypothetical protein